MSVLTRPAIRFQQLSKKVAMIKNFLIAAMLVIGSPALVFSQDVIFSFDQTTLQTTENGVAGSSGTAFIFSDQTLAFDFLGLDVTSSDSSVLSLTGVNFFNAPFTNGDPPAFEATDEKPLPGGGFFISVSSSVTAIDPAETVANNPQFEAGVGPNGGVLLASVDFDILAPGTADLVVGPNPIASGAINGTPAIFFVPVGSSATLVASAAAIPEPSSAAFLILGAASFVARRRRN